MVLDAATINALVIEDVEMDLMRAIFRHVWEEVGESFPGLFDGFRGAARPIWTCVLKERKANIGEA